MEYTLQEQVWKEVEVHHSGGPILGTKAFQSPYTSHRNELETVHSDGRGTIPVPTLVVKKGKTDQREYVLNDKLTVVGKSALATVKLKSWFAPKVAAQISRREDQTYYVGAADKLPRVNGQLIAPFGTARRLVDVGEVQR